MTYTEIINGSSVKTPWPRTPSEKDKHACQQALSYTFLLGDCLILFSFIAAFIFYKIDKRTEDEEAAIFRMSDGDYTLENAVNQDSSDNMKKQIRLSDVFDLPKLYWILIFIIGLFYAVIFPVKYTLYPFVAFAKPYLLLLL